MRDKWTNSMHHKVRIREPKEDHIIDTFAFEPLNCSLPAIDSMTGRRQKRQETLVRHGVGLRRQLVLLPF
jgi:hypothetical protein